MPADPPRNRLMPPRPLAWEETPEFRLRVEFQVLVLTLGDKEARRLWKEAAKKKRGRARGSTKPEHDVVLLEFYDSYVASPERQEPIKSLPRVIGQHVHNEHPGEYGATAGGVTARLRRLLEQRAKKAVVRPRSHRNLLAPDWQNK